MQEKLKAGFIGFVNMEEDPWPLLEEYARIGYRGCESGERYITRDGKEKEDYNKKRLTQLGLECLTVSTINGEMLRKDGWESLASRAHNVNVDRAVMFHGATYFKKLNKEVSYDEVMMEIDLLQKAAEGCKREGVKFAYHNHDTEFTTFYNGMSVFEMLLAYAPDLWFELDVGWVTYAGLDPVVLLKKLAPRLSAVHFKDYKPGDKYTSLWGSKEKYRMPNFCSVGSGVLKLDDCLKACSELGIEWAIVEQDFMHELNRTEALQAAFLSMKESGLLE